MLSAESFWMRFELTPVNPPIPKPIRFQICFMHVWLWSQMDVPFLNLENRQTVINSVQTDDAVYVILMDIECNVEPTPTSTCFGSMFIGGRYKAELMLFLQRVAVIAAKINEPELVLY